jgi:hypothetical protein
MRTVSILGLGVLAMIFAFPAEALTISNVDPDPHTITVTVGSDSNELTIEPQTEVDPPCDKGCKVELENGEQYEMKGDESVSIEDGVIFVDAAPSEEGDDGAAAGATPDEPSDTEPDQGDNAEAPPADSPPADAAPQAH